MYRLGEDLRSVFQAPFGPVVRTEDVVGQVRKGDVLVCVGDMVARTAIWLGLEPKLIVVDFRTERKDLDEDIQAELRRYGKTVLRVRNPAATVTKDLYAAVVQGLRLAGPVRVEVDGEEDLAGLPVLAEAPMGTVVFYGMPGQGVVVVRVDEAIRAKAKALLDRMRVP